MNKQVDKNIIYSNSYGWICPRCGRVNAPWIDHCDCNDYVTWASTESPSINLTQGPTTCTSTSSIGSTAVTYTLYSDTGAIKETSTEKDKNISK